MRALGRFVVLVLGAMTIQFGADKPSWLCALTVFVGACLIEWCAVDKFKDRNDL